MSAPSRIVRTRDLFEQPLLPALQLLPEQLPHLNFRKVSTKGHNTLLVIPSGSEARCTIKSVPDGPPTQYSSKNGVLIADVTSLGVQGGLFYVVIPFEGQGEQPNRRVTGIMSGFDRIKRGLEFVERQNLLKHDDYGLVYIGSIENFMDGDFVAGPVEDQALKILYRIHDSHSWCALSQRVPAQLDVVQQARKRGFTNDTESYGLITCGSVYADIWGVDSRDWHLTVCGTSRFSILHEAKYTMHYNGSVWSKCAFE